MVEGKTRKYRYGVVITFNHRYRTLAFLLNSKIEVPSLFIYSQALSMSAFLICTIVHESRLNKVLYISTELKPTYW